jgi:hypothetical protein
VISGLVTKIIPAKYRIDEFIQLNFQITNKKNRTKTTPLKIMNISELFMLSILYIEINPTFEDTKPLKFGKALMATIQPSVGF